MAGILIVPATCFSFERRLSGISRVRFTGRSNTGLHAPIKWEEPYRILVTH
jgi:hypothetical protein